MPNRENAITRLLERFPIIYQFLRFAAIGFLNVAINFLILNGISKALGISEGLPLGAVEAVAFVFALIQSYLWNRMWTFGGEQGISLWKNFLRLVLVGSVGAFSIILVLVGSKFFAPPYYYFGILLVFLICQIVLWRTFGFHTSTAGHTGNSFIAFFIVTLVGFGINVGLVSLISLHLHITHTDLDKNLAAVAATAVSLFWNFFGYKVVVFKK
ncbi:MAG: GtrA family protein [Candidatus Doudnabacteria bacterium]|nr:GtrA family protein [Candidatus Doudnabacteria bacterium]